MGERKQRESCKSLIYQVEKYSKALEGHVENGNLKGFDYVLQQKERYTERLDNRLSDIACWLFERYDRIPQNKAGVAMQVAMYLQDTQSLFKEMHEERTMNKLRDGIIYEINSMKKTLLNNCEREIKKYSDGGDVANVAEMGRKIRRIAIERRDGARFHNRKKLADTYQSWISKYALESPHFVKLLEDAVANKWKMDVDEEDLSSS